MWIALLVAAYFLLAFIQYGMFAAMAWPLSFVPVLFVAAVLLYHRNQVTLGVTWIAAMIISQHILGFGVFHPFALLVTCILMVPLVARVFTNRSIYALIGFGLVSYSILLISNAITTLVVRSLLGRPSQFAIHGSTINVRIATLVVALTIGFVLARWLSKVLRQFFYIRNAS